MLNFVEHARRQNLALRNTLCGFEKSWSKIYKFLKRTPFLKPADNDPLSEISWEELANQAALFDLGLNEELDEETEKLVRDFETNFEGHLLKVFIGHKSINLRKS